MNGTENLSEPKLFEHCKHAYEKMEGSKTTASDGEFYVGNLSELVESLGLSRSYASRIIGRLKEMGCVAAVRRGGGSAKTVLQLIKLPLLDDFEQVDRVIPSATQNRIEENANKQRIEDLNRRITIIEQWLSEKFDAPF